MEYACLKIGIDDSIIEKAAKIKAAFWFTTVENYLLAAEAVAGAADCEASLPNHLSWIF